MLLEGRARSIGELVDETVRLSKKLKGNYRQPEELWFRGQRNSSQSLIPNLYAPAIRRFRYDEASLIDRFRSLATPFLDQPPATDWEWYFLARHHGLPSRLLDWTESLLTAVLFALNEHIPADRLQRDDLVQTQPRKRIYDDTSPAIWMLDAGSLNDVALNEDVILVPGGSLTARYLPDGVERKTRRNALPLAILPVRANARIVAQQGMFTIHGHSKRSLDQLAKTYARLKLVKIRLDRSRSAHLSRELEVLGINRLTLFPDLDTVASRVCWMYQSAV